MLAEESFMHKLYTVELGRPQENCDDCVKHCMGIIIISMLVRPCTVKCYYKEKKWHQGHKDIYFYLLFTFSDFLILISLCLNSHHFICGKEHTLNFSGT